MGQTIGLSSGPVGAGGSAATPGVPAEDRWTGGGGTAAPEVLMEGGGSAAAPHELMGPGGSTAMPEVSTERGGSATMPEVSTERDNSVVAPSVIRETSLPVRERQLSVFQTNIG